MILLYFGILFVNLVFLMFTYTYQINGINRTIIATPTSIIESSIPLTTSSETPVLYYDQDSLKNNYQTYLDRELKKYTQEYEVEYYFYNTSDGGFCDVTNCQGVEIKVEAKVLFSFNYSRTMKYEIVEGDIAWKKAL